jgi:hypothetical protein
MLFSFHVADQTPQAFADFKQRFGRSYASPAENALREEIFTANLRAIHAHNARAVGDDDFRLGVGPFADLTNLEYRNKVLMRKKIDRSGLSQMSVAGGSASGPYNCPCMCSSFVLLPDSSQ